MKFERKTAVFVLAAGLLAGGVLSAAPADTAPPPAKPADAANATPPVTSGLKSPVAAVAPKPRPLGNEHKILGALVGHWKSKIPPQITGPAVTNQESESTADGKLVMGGRFAQVAPQGSMGGQPFEGMMLVGFDEVINRYTASWVDTTSNAIIHYVGTFDAAKKQLTLTAHYSEPNTRRLTIERVVLTFADANIWTYDEYTAHSVGEKETHTTALAFNRG